MAMIESLSQHCEEFHLYVFAYDEKAYTYLIKRNYPNVTVLSLNQLEKHFPQLLDVKPSRSFAEYCWTTTAFTIKYCLEHFDIDQCTYLDADLFFFANPRVLVEEMGNDDVLITEHRYTPEYDQTITAGKYCVQFLTAKNNANGREVIDWWKDACYDWCYSRYEDGKFGDQKYLDDWTTRFEGVHVLQNLGGGLAPWNIQQYDLARITPIFYHFHYVKGFEIGGVYEYLLGPYDLPAMAKRLFYKPYMAKIGCLHRQLLTDGFTETELGYGKIAESAWLKPLHIVRSLFRQNKLIKRY